MDKLFILNADDLGMSKSRNEAILAGYKGGLLKSTSICANGDEFESAVEKILPACPGLGVGLHLNIIEGKALLPISRLTDQQGNFNNGFFKILLKSANKAFVRDVEKEFRAQIEKGRRYIKIDHLDSHIHVHAIPPLFKIAVRLAGLYGIPYVRTQHEKFYAVPRRFCLARLVNLLKILLLNIFSRRNKKTLRAAGLKTNDFIIGVGYTGMMDAAAVEYGLRAVAGGALTEALIHPGAEGQINEFNLTQNKDLAEKIKAMGFRISNYNLQEITGNQS